MAIGVAELEEAYAKALDRIRALQGLSTQKLWEQEVARLDRLHRKAMLASGKRSRALKIMMQAEADFLDAYQQILKVRKVKV